MIEMLSRTSETTYYNFITYSQNYITSNKLKFLYFAPMKKQNNILQKFRKHISFSLILSMLLFSSGQAFIFSDCKCNHSEPTVIESTNCCGEVVEIEVVKTDCCTSESEHNEVKFESTMSHSCPDCSTGCSLDKNVEYSSPTLFANISFSLKNIDEIEIDYINLNSDKSNTSDISNKLKHKQNDEIPKLFGKNLLIQTHTLKIPLILG